LACNLAPNEATCSGEAVWVTVVNNTPVPRPAWIATVLIALVSAALLLLSGYVGYAGLSLAVGASAAINLL
jgi:hypothetical protein